MNYLHPALAILAPSIHTRHSRHATLESNTYVLACDDSRQMLLAWHSLLLELRACFAGPVLACTMRPSLSWARVKVATI